MIKVNKIPNILVIGDLMIDEYLWGSCERISPEAPVPIVAVEKSEKRLGGAANVALNIQALGANAILCAPVGDDKSGEDFIQLLKDNELPTEGVLQIESDGSYTFTPTANFNGDVPQVTYTANDGLNSVMSTLDIVVNPINDAPIAVLDTNTTNEDTPLTVTAANGLLTNDSDTENSSLSVTTFTVNGSTENANGTINLPGIGDFTINDDGSYVFVPATDYTGGIPDVTYTITDNNPGTPGTASPTLSIKINIDFAKFAEILQSSHIAVSTAIHEFFGIGIAEAVSAGAFPVVPERLAYPEILQKDQNDENKLSFFY